MPSDDHLRARVLGILQGRSVAPQGVATNFSSFRPEQVAQATALSRRFSEIAAKEPGNAGVAAVLDEAQRLIGSELPAIVKYALLIFLTHDANGARLGVPGLEQRHPAAVVSMVAAQTASNDPLAYFREDVLANEHHEHWHLVYVSNPDVSEKERQGELFLYMHEQMLARYDTERLALGQPRVVSLDLTEAFAEGYDPHWPGGGYVARPAGASLKAGESHDLDSRTQAFLKAAADGTFERLVKGSGPFRATGPQPALDLLGSTIEAHGDADKNFVGYQLHNNGHMDIAAITGTLKDGPYGVMANTATAIRDPIFWRWHRLIDDSAFSWQESQGPRDFTKQPDAPPPVAIADKGLIIANAIALAHAGFTDFSDEEAGEAKAQTLFGEGHWETDYSSAAPATSQLTTQMATRTWTATIGSETPGEGQAWPAQTVEYLDLGDEFAYLIRLQSTSSTPIEVTVRVFLAASEQAHDRRMWIEMDKFLRTLEPDEKRVLYRPSSLSSVIRKPAQRPPGPPPVEQHDEMFDYCQCGWPYNLLLPRGTSAGMAFKLMVMVTDAGFDKVTDEHTCGGMSFCGVRDRYPDARNMGYPFDRPFPNSDALAGISSLSNVAVRDLTIKAT